MVVVNPLPALLVLVSLLVLPSAHAETPGEFATAFVADTVETGERAVGEAETDAGVVLALVEAYWIDGDDADGDGVPDDAESHV